MFNAALLSETSHCVALMNLTAHQIVCSAYLSIYHYTTFGVFEKGFKLRNGCQPNSHQQSAVSGQLGVTTRVSTSY